MNDCDNCVHHIDDVCEHYYELNVTTCTGFRPVTPQGDLISREALRNVILNDRKLDGANANWEVNRILVHIDNAPTVDLTKNQAYDKGFITAMKLYVRPQGEWIEPYESKIAQECSICHRQMPAPKWFYYCPNCGAKMKGGAE